MARHVFTLTGEELGTIGGAFHFIKWISGLSFVILFGIYLAQRFPGHELDLGWTSVFVIPLLLGALLIFFVSWGTLAVMRGIRNEHYKATGGSGH